MKFRVESGPHSLVIERPSPRQSAVDALRVWHWKMLNSDLGDAVLVYEVEKDVPIEPLIFSTQELEEEMMKTL